MEYMEQKMDDLIESGIQLRDAYEKEVDELRKLQADHSRWFSKEEWDRLQELLILLYPSNPNPK